MSILTDLIEENQTAVDEFEQTGEMSEELYDALYEYYLLSGEMPYGIAKAREGDPIVWVADTFRDEMGFY